MSFNRYASEAAVQALKRTFPQMLAAPWRGGEGASGDCITVEHGIMKVSLYKGVKCWFADASGRAGVESLSETATSALEAAEKLKRAMQNQSN